MDKLLPFTVVLVAEYPSCAGAREVGIILFAEEYAQEVGAIVAVGVGVGSAVGVGVGSTVAAGVEVGAIVGVGVGAGTPTTLETISPAL
jgi:hypothetical protein